VVGGPMSPPDRLAVIVLDALNEMNRVRPEELRVSTAPETPLIGAAGALDSIELVTLLFTIESAVFDQMGAALQLTESPALFDAGGPLTSIELLIGHLHRQLDGGAAAGGGERDGKER
jgi:hypothetical protein